MNSRERVKRAIHFQNPDRLPYNFDQNRTPVPWEESYGDDFVWCFLDKDKDHVDRSPDGDRIDEWGCLWKTMGETFGEPTTFPLEGLETFDDYELPRFLLDYRYDSIRKVVKENNGEKYVLAMMPTGIFQIMLHLFGFEDFMCQVAGNTEEFAKFASRLCDLAIESIKKFAECGVDGMILIEDMGLQDRMMISPRHWKEIFYPLYKKMFKVAHDLGIDTISHTCGHIVDILDMYIESGLDVIQMDQQDNMGLEVLSERFKGKVCFFCCYDIQTSLNYTDEEMDAQAKKMISLLCTKDGGFMSKTYPQPKAIRISNDYMRKMSDAFKKYGDNYKDIVE